MNWVRVSGEKAKPQGGAPRSVAFNQESIDFYRLAQGRLTLPATDEVEVADAGEAHIDEYAWPVSIFRFAAVDKGDIFHYLRVGNILPIRLVNYGFTRGILGFEGHIRVIARSYDLRRSDKMLLTMAEVRI